MRSPPRLNPVGRDPSAVGLGRRRERRRATPRKRSTTSGSSALREQLAERRSRSRRCTRPRRGTCSPRRRPPTSASAATAAARSTSLPSSWATSSTRARSPSRTVWQSRSHTSLDPPSPRLTVSASRPTAASAEAVGGERQDGRAVDGLVAQQDDRAGRDLAGEGAVLGRADDTRRGGARRRGRRRSAAAWRRSARRRRRRRPTTPSPSSRAPGRCSVPHHAVRHLDVEAGGQRARRRRGARRSSR